MSMRALYQEVILDHNKKPRNFGPLDEHTCSAEGDNPLCGDNYTIYARLAEDKTIEAVSFSGTGCAISKAAASMMTVRMKGKSVDEAQELIGEFRQMLMGELDPDSEPTQLGHLTVFKGVSQRPERVKCAVLPWHALDAALKGRDQVSTEGADDPLEQED